MQALEIQGIKMQALLEESFFIGHIHNYRALAVDITQSTLRHSVRQPGER